VGGHFSAMTEPSQLAGLLRAIDGYTGTPEVKAALQISPMVFASARTPNGSRCLSDVALLAALRRMGFTKDEMTIHGFRAVARTILDEVLGFRPDFIEHQLAHAVKDPNGRAYNRTAHLEARREMMQVWFDYLDKLKIIS
jgi:integrase